MISKLLFRLCKFLVTFKYGPDICHFSLILCVYVGICWTLDLGGMIYSYFVFPSTYIIHIIIEELIISTGMHT
jgi:hypothetical protein